MQNIADVQNTDNGQIILLPSDFRLPGSQATVRREGEALIIEPLKATTWPTSFFQAIQIDDPAFGRPKQGALPPCVELE